MCWVEDTKKATGLVVQLVSTFEGHDLRSICFETNIYSGVYFITILCLSRYGTILIIFDVEGNDMKTPRPLGVIEF